MEAYLMVEGPSGGNGRGQIGDILAVGSRAPGSGRVQLDVPARPGEPTLRWRSRVHTIPEIQQELARIWAEPNLQTMVDGEPGRHVAARTSVMNLVVVARRPEVGERCAATIQLLTGRHPSRTLIVSAADPDGPPWLDAQIQAHCVLPRDEAPEICAELVYLTAGGESGRHLGAVIAPLLIHDLPVTIWWPDDPPFSSPPAIELMKTADRLVVDGSSWHDDGLVRLRQMAGLLDTTTLAIRDFALVRQARWREAIASIFDMPEFLPYLHSIRRIAVSYATHDPTGAPASTNLVKPVYHVAWLGSRLGMHVHEALAPAPQKPKPGSQMSRGLVATLEHGRTDVAVVVRPVLSEAPSGTTLRVELLAERRGSELRADVTAEKESVHVRVWLDGIEELDRAFLAPRLTDFDLLADAIESGPRDPIADGALRKAAELVGDRGDRATQASRPSLGASA
jgi:hypothetical protein